MKYAARTGCWPISSGLSFRTILLIGVASCTTGATKGEANLPDAAAEARTEAQGGKPATVPSGRGGSTDNPAVSTGQGGSPATPGIGGSPGIEGSGSSRDAAGSTAVPAPKPDAATTTVATDAGPGTAAGGGGFITPRAGFTPASLTNLVVWLDASKDVTATGAKVSKWADQSSAHNDATQSNAAKQPLLTLAGLAGKPVLSFKKSTLTIADSPSLNWGAGDFTVTMVANYRNKAGIHLAGFAYFFHKNAKVAVEGRPEAAEVILAGNWPNGDTVPMVTKITASLNAHMIKAHSKDVGYNDGAFRVLTATRSGGKKLDIRINGAVAGTTGATWNVDSVGTPATLGSATSGGFPIEGDIAEVVILKGITNPEDIQALEAYLAAKFGFKP